MFCLNIISNIFVKSYAHVWVRIIPPKNPLLEEKNLNLKTYWGCIQGESLGGYLKINLMCNKLVFLKHITFKLITKDNILIGKLITCEFKLLKF